MNECNDHKHDSINAERAESRVLRTEWIKADDENQILRKENAVLQKRLQNRLQTIDGNLFDFFEDKKDVNIDTIAHVCNCRGVMGSGIALSIKERYPQVWQAYRRHEEVNSGIKLGTISGTSILPKKYVINLHVQEFYGTEKRHLNYEALYVCLMQIMFAQQLKTLGIPYNMGSDRAGGDWEIVTAMINSVFKNFNVYACKL